MKPIVLLNGKAGSLAASTNQDDVERVREEFLAVGVEAEVRAVFGPDLTAAARRAAEGGAEVVVAGGGDGTVSTVAAILAGTNVTMGILPLGTLNHFARDLGIPLSVAAAAKVIAAGQARQVDVAEVNGRVFINNSSIGIYPQVVRDRDSQRARLGRGKWLAMFVAVLNTLRRFPVVRVRLSIADQTVARKTPFVFIGNNEYEMSLFSVRDRHQLDGGQLSLYVANRTGRFGMVRLALRAALGRLEQAKDFESVLLPEVWIETRKRHLHISLDGEVARLSPPLHYQIRPKALRVFAPVQPASAPGENPLGTQHSALST